MDKFGIMSLIIMTISYSIPMIAISFIKPIFLYIWGGAVILTVPIVLTFVFIDKL